MILSAKGNSKLNRLKSIIGHAQAWAGSLKSRQQTIKTKLSGATHSQPNYQNIHNHNKNNRTDTTIPKLPQHTKS